MIPVLAIYRGKLLDHRGTPIRVRSLLEEVEADPRIALTVASWDKEAPQFARHLTLSNDHVGDLRLLYRTAKAIGARVIIGHTTSASYYLVPLRFLTGAKIVLEMHGLEEEEARAYGDIGVLWYWTLKIWHVVLYRLCALITTCSKSVTDIIKPHCPNTISLTGGVDPSVFNPHVPRGSIIAADGRIVIGYAGNTRVWQGLDFLITTFRTMCRTHPEFRLALLLSDRRGVEAGDGVELYGPVPHDDVPKFLTDCDILVIPRPDTAVTRISFPSKIPEHLAMGRAVIASNTGDADQVIRDGVNGLLYTPERADELSAALLRLRDTALRESLGAAAAASAQALSWKKLGARFVDNIVEIA